MHSFIVNLFKMSRVLEAYLLLFPIIGRRLRNKISFTNQGNGETSFALVDELEGEEREFLINLVDWLPK